MLSTLHDVYSGCPIHDVVGFFFGSLSLVYLSELFTVMSETTKATTTAVLVFPEGVVVVEGLVD